MNSASILFGWILATLLGALFHLWRDGGFWKLVLYIALSWVGFLIGHLIASNAGFTLMQVGQVYLGGGVLGSVLFLFVGHWLAGTQTTQRKQA